MKSADVDGLGSALDRVLKKEKSMTAEEMREELEKANARIIELEENIAKYEKGVHDKEEEEETYGKMAHPKMSDEDEEEEFMKSAPAPVARAFEKARETARVAIEKAAVAEAELLAQRESVADSQAIEKARGWGHLSLDAEEVGPMLRRLEDQNEDLAKAVSGLLDSINAQAESANIFAEIGKSASPLGVNGDAVARLTSLAKSMVEAGTVNTIEQGFTEVAMSNPDLYVQYLTEKGA